MLILLIGAVITDLLFDKIYNEWLLIFLVLGFSMQIWNSGTLRLLYVLITIAIPGVILYPLFKIGALGAGDIKLFIVIGCFVSPSGLLKCMMYSFLIGGVFSLLVLIWERSFFSRMTHLISYIHDTFKNKTWELYDKSTNEVKKPFGIKRRAGKIHFSVAILMGVLLWIGGIG